MVPDAAAAVVVLDVAADAIDAVSNKLVTLCVHQKWTLFYLSSL